MIDHDVTLLLLLPPADDNSDVTAARLAVISRGFLLRKVRVNYLPKYADPSSFAQCDKCDGRTIS